ncbi:MAG TPA: ABC transporter ATP-binding protein, partial [Halobacteriales archaeon]|nr:ABC transporter ATP-binding protein [Halobacteriales archaeon]
LESFKGRKLSMVFQDPMSGLNPVFTIGEQLTDTAQFGGESDTGVLSYYRRKHSDEREDAHRHVVDLLEEVQMPDPERIMESYPTELSGGMRQRALIAQALLNDPELLIADEIGTALDVTIHDQIMKLLERLIEERDLSVLMITHNLGVAREVSDRVYVMYAGRTIESAPTETLFELPKHPYTQGLIASIPRLTGDEMAEGIDGVIPQYIDPPPGCRFAPRCPYAHERCTGGKPPRYATEDGSSVACYLHDPDTDRFETPTLAETRTALAGTDDVLDGTPAMEGDS